MTTRKPLIATAMDGLIADFAGLSLEEIIEEVEALRDEPIEIETLQLPQDAPTGLWLKEGYEDGQVVNILVLAQGLGVLEVHTLLHELAHMARGDDQAQPASEMTTSECNALAAAQHLSRGGSLELVSCRLRSEAQSEAERACELFAMRLGRPPAAPHGYHRLMRTYTQGL